MYPRALKRKNIEKINIEGLVSRDKKYTEPLPKQYYIIQQLSLAFSQVQRKKVFTNQIFFVFRWFVCFNAFFDKISAVWVEGEYINPSVKRLQSSCGGGGGGFTDIWSLKRVFVF